MKIAERIKNVPPYLFAEIDKKKEAAIARGVDIINLGIGDPDKPTPSYIIDQLEKSARDPKTHDYPPYEGTKEFRSAAAEWYLKRFGVKLDPYKEIISLIGSKEGIAHVFLAFIDPGDISLIPDPAYPVYKTGTLFANGKPYYMPLLAENGFLPDLDKIDEGIAKKAKLIFLNYPNNPTGAVASLDYFKEVVDFAKKYNLLICHDFAYSELAYDGYKSPSILEIEGAKDISLEFHSLSKTYNMTGWRIGFAVGGQEAISALSIIKTNVDSGIFKAIQEAGVTALTGPQDHIPQMIDMYTERRNVIVEGLNKLGWSLEAPKGTFYVWAPTPAGMSSIDFANKVLEKTGIIVTPGVGYGQYGEGYFRIALTVDVPRMKEAIGRLEKANIIYTA
ncbi:MAG: LL-diaminopimelate aminotransferase [Candidatus Caldatribacteriota bacterium]|jgi:LL-diaminopimelate aminotransferase|nr:LL-diaminopimelate aminotransferase [Atribacterota bacterium]MDD3641528.1 LL-diaminopimelate aminotransferase [Atribacterota bacterium]MDD4288307.1 LL-diaminopimelate aminotransferase [Atribacterota bacterium]MDD4764548.1 LL-diaminopimelate aminotransferase [Atribacterota bacterium]